MVVLVVIRHQLHSVLGLWRDKHHGAIFREEDRDIKSTTTDNTLCQQRSTRIKNSGLQHYFGSNAFCVFVPKKTNKLVLSGQRTLFGCECVVVCLCFSVLNWQTILDVTCLFPTAARKGSGTSVTRKRTQRGCVFFHFILRPTVSRTGTDPWPGSWVPLL